MRPLLHIILFIEEVEDERDLSDPRLSLRSRSLEDSDALAVGMKKKVVRAGRETQGHFRMADRPEPAIFVFRTQSAQVS